MADYGYNVYDLDNPIVPSTLTAETDPVRSIELKVFIKDDNEEWVDFSDRMESRGKNKLIDYSIFKHTTERRGGLPLLESAVNSVIFDNSDGFFDQEITGLKTEEGNDADFSTKRSINKTETSWKNKEIKFEMHLLLIDDSVIIKTAGLYIIKETSTKHGETSSFSIESQTRMNLLKEVDASVVKSGVNWYRNKSINFLIKELLKTRFANVNGDLPPSYHIDNIVSIPVPDEVGKAYSIFGEPPQDSDGLNFEKSYIRCADIWNYNSGTVSSSNDRAFTITSSANWTTGSYLKPEAGDIITIKNSSNGNDGDYEIDSISGTSVTLKTPLHGTTESTMSFNISRIYFIHKDRELWKFIPMSNTYIYIGRCDSAYHIGYTYSLKNGLGIPAKMFIKNDNIYIIESRIPFYGTPEGVTKGFWNDYDTSESIDKMLVYDGNDISVLLDDSLEYCSGGGAECSVFMAMKLPIGLADVGGTKINDDENLFIPFHQGIKIHYSTRSPSIGNINTTHLRYSDEIDSSSYSAPPIDPGPWTSDNVTVDRYPNFIPRGYWTFGDYTNNLLDEKFPIIMFSWNEGPKICFADDWGLSGSIVFLYAIPEYNDDPWDSGTFEKRLTIRVHDIESGVDSFYYLEDSGYRSMGVTITYNRFSEKCIVIACWIADPSATPTDEIIVSRAYEFDSVGNFQTLEYDNSEYLTVLDLVAVNSTTYIMSLIYRNDKVNPYRLVYATFGSGPSYNLSITTSFRRSACPFIRLTSAGPNPTDTSKDDVVLFHKYENRVLKYDANSDTMTVQANGSEVVADESNISSPLLVDIYSRHEDIIVYGISWSGEDPVFTDKLLIPNKGVLWKLDNYITPYIELADFNGLSVADAIGKLAQACNYLAFFNVEGDFYFVPRSLEESEDYIFEINDNKSLSSGDIIKDNGYKEIYNHFTVIPYITEVSEVSYDITLVKRNDNEESQDIRDTIQINSLNNLNRIVRLVCIRSGILSEEPLFKWLITYSEINGRLKSELSNTGREFQLSSVFGGDQLEEGIHTGDFIIFVEPSDGASIVREIIGGKGINNLTATTTGSPDISVTDSSIYEVGDIVHAVYDTGGDDYRFKSKVASINGTDITLSEDFPHTLSGIYDLLAPIKNSSGYISIANATSVTIPSGSEVQILKASSSSDSDLKKTWSSDDLTFLLSDVSGTIIYVNKISNVAVNCYLKTNESDFIKVTAVDENSNGITLEETLVASKDDMLSLFWVPLLNTFVEIPSSGFEVNITNSEVFFKEGDVIVISTEGLVLKEDERSRKLAVSLDSKDRYGKKDFSTIKNRFINEKLAEVLSRNLLSFYKHPRYHLNLSIYLMPLIDFVRINRLASFKIISKILFPRAKNYSRYFYLRSLENNIKNKSTSLELIDKDFY